MKLVSVIIPVYNAANTIELTLQSVFNQTMSRDLIEIIIVNDGSTDSTLSILESYTNYCKIITTENKGVSAARNIGFDNSIGKYIQYLDSDDLLIPDKLEMQVSALKDSNADIAYGNWSKFKFENNNKIVLENVERSITGRPEIELFRNFWCPPAAILYTREICIKIGSWNTRLPIIQDARYLLDAALNNGKFVYTNKIVAEYRLNQKNSLSTNNADAFVSDCFLNAKEIASIWVDDFLFDLEKRQVTIEVFRYCINEFSSTSKINLNQAIDAILMIDPNFIPTHSLELKWASRIFGYRNAEHFASFKRKFMKRFKHNTN